jgi:hypothetical protein
MSLILQTIALHIIDLEPSFLLQQLLKLTRTWQFQEIWSSFYRMQHSTKCPDFAFVVRKVKCTHHIYVTIGHSSVKVSFTILHGRSCAFLGSINLQFLGHYQPPWHEFNCSEENRLVKVPDIQTKLWGMWTANWWFVHRFDWDWKKILTFVGSKVFLQVCLSFLDFQLVLLKCALL